MSEFGFLAFGSADEVDPVEAVQKTAAAIENISRELEERGITAFALQADSAPEVEQRLLMREVNAAIDEIVERYLPEDDDAKKRVVSNIFRQFEAGDGEFGGYQLRAPIAGPGTFNNPDLDPSTFQRRPGNTRDQDFSAFLENGGKRESICPGDGFIHGVSSGQDRCGLHGGMTTLRFDDPHPELAALARDLHEEREHQFKTRKYPFRSGEAQADFVKKWEDHIQMKRDGGIQQTLPGVEGNVKEGAEAPGEQFARGYFKGPLKELVYPPRPVQLSLPHGGQGSEYGITPPGATNYRSKSFCKDCGRSHFTDDHSLGGPHPLDGQDLWTRNNMRPGQ